MNELKLALKMAKPISTLDLSTNTYNSICRWGYGIKTIADLYVYHIEHTDGIGHIRGIGIKSISEINDLLIANGLPTLEQLKEQTETWHGYHNDLEMPKGTFERIFNDCEENNDV